MGLFSVAKSPYEKQLSQLIQKSFGFKPRKLALYKQALRHKSAAREIRDGLKDSNERLEFLGDAILDAVVAHYLFQAYPFKDEGFLTKLRSKIVSRSQLNRLAKELKIDDLLEMNLNGSVRHKSLNGNALEALIGAIYLERGFKYTERILVDQMLKKHVDIAELEKTETNYKSKLLEWAQKERKKVVFKVTDEKDMGYQKVYSVIVMINGEPNASGTGTSKKEAEQAAAHTTWKRMFRTKASSEN